MTDVDGERHLARYFFTLPEPLPFPDGFQLLDSVGNSPAAEPRPDDPWVLLRFHQRQAPSSWIGRSEAVFDVVYAQPELALLRPSGPTATLSPTMPGSPVTIVDAITVFQSPDLPPDDWDGRAQTLLPRADALNRCIRLIDDHLRAYRLATLSAHGPLTYERMPPLAIAFGADHAEAPTDEPRVTAVSDLDWRGPSLIVLEHLNSPDPVAGDTIDDEIAARMEFWFAESARNSPFAAWRERYLDALGALRLRGDTALAVIAAQTSSEMLLDSILSLLMWEEGMDPVAAATRFEEGKTLSRIVTEIAPRLKGSWALGGRGPVAAWYAHSNRLRNRVVHGGLRPSRVDADQALDAVGHLERYVFDRLAARRTTYMRSALMTLSKEGLIQRNLWAGKIRAFAEGPAREEPSWRDSFKAWREAFTTARLATPS